MSWPSEYYYVVEQRDNSTGNWVTTLRGKTSKELDKYVTRLIMNNRSDGAVRLVKAFDVDGGTRKIKDVIVYHELTKG